MRGCEGNDSSRLYLLARLTGENDAVDVDEEVRVTHDFSLRHAVDRHTVGDPELARLFTQAHEVHAADRGHGAPAGTGVTGHLEVPDRTDLALDHLLGRQRDDRRLVVLVNDRHDLSDDHSIGARDIGHHRLGHANRGDLARGARTLCEEHRGAVDDEALVFGGDRDLKLLRIFGIEAVAVVDRCLLRSDCASPGACRSVGGQPGRARRGPR